MIPRNRQAELCLNLRICILMLSFTIWSANSIWAQDLIERTKTNASLKSNALPNSISKQISGISNFESGPAFIYIPQSDNKTYSQRDLKDHVDLILDEGAINSLYKKNPQNLRLEIPVDNKNQFSLLLRQVDILAPDFQLLNSQGVVNLKEEMKPKFYRGIVESDKNSLVSAVIVNGIIKITIHDQWGNYEISQLPEIKNSYVLFNADKLQNVVQPPCLTDDIKHSIKTKISEAASQSYQKSSNCIPLYIETDKYTFDSFNSDLMDLQNYIVTLINEVATLYSNDNMSISLTQIYVATETVDDWSSSISDLGILIERFAEVRQNDYVGRLAHFITMRDLGGGLGWIGVLCSQYTTFWADLDGDGMEEEHHYGPYAVSSSLNGINIPIPTYSFDVAVVAHEMGHNIGSPHTHHCSWGPSNLAIDNCANTEGGCGLLTEPVNPSDLGTLMSYCHLTQTGIDFTKGFGSLPGQLMRSNIDIASCVLDCTINAQEGCTDPSFHNYDPNALSDDGSCTGTCDDGIKNGDETGIDCGGVMCLPCIETCTLNYVRLTLNFDNQPQETHWTLSLTSSLTIIESGGPYSEEPDGSQLFVDMCLPDDDYTFTIYDNWGDGMCCSSGNGSYTLMGIDNEVLASGGQFTSSEASEFTLANVTCSNMLVVSGAPINGSFMSSDTLMTSGLVEIDNNATFNSPQMDIYPGFTVNTGAVFEAYQDGCQN